MNESFIVTETKLLIERSKLIGELFLDGFRSKNNADEDCFDSEDIPTRKFNVFDILAKPDKKD